MARPLGRDLAVHHGSVGLSDTQLQRGEFLALEVTSSEAIRLPAGTALDDFIADTARADADAAARAQMRAWREQRRAALTSDGVDLTQVWEVELLATCFLALARLRAAMPRIVAELAPRRLVCTGLAPEMFALVASVAREHGVHAVAASGGGTRGAITGSRRSPLARLVAAVGVPPRVRGSVVCVPYWNLQPVLARLAARDSRVRPVAYGVTLPVASRPDLLRTAWSGGWIGHPSRRARQHSRERAVGLLADIEDSEASGTPAAAVDALARRHLQNNAGETFALAAQARGGLAAGRARLVLVPFDSPPDMRILLAAAHDAGVPSLLVQHGFDADLGDPDKTIAGHIAAWSQADCDRDRSRTGAVVTLTGNPGVAHLAQRAHRRPPPTGRSLVLVEYASRLSARVPARISATHTSAALSALAHARPGTTAIIRPHPFDPHAHGYLRLAADHPQLTVEVDSRTPIEDLLAGVDVCVGALSTATLQAAVLEVPVVFLDVTGIDRPWPLDGTSGALPCARSASELAALVSVALDREEVTGREAAAEALGVRSEAVERVCALVEALAECARGSPGP